MAQQITREQVEAWFADNLPDLAIDQDRDEMGYYRRDLGRAFFFYSVGYTWAEVLEAGHRKLAQRQDDERRRADGQKFWL